MNYLERNPDFLKRLENAVDPPTKATGESVNLLSVVLGLLAIAGAAAVAYKIFEPRIVINHYHPPKQSGGAVPPVAETKKPNQNTLTQN